MSISHKPCSMRHELEPCAICVACAAVPQPQRTGTPEHASACGVDASPDAPATPRWRSAATSGAAQSRKTSRRRHDDTQLIASFVEACCLHHALPCAALPTLQTRASHPETATCCGDEPPMSIDAGTSCIDSDAQGVDSRTSLLGAASFEVSWPGGGAHSTAST